MSKKNLSNLVIDWYKKTLVTTLASKQYKSENRSLLSFCVRIYASANYCKNSCTTYFTTFVKRFPKNAKLAKANLEDVLSIWSGLGYYRRANYLLLSSKIISTKFYNKIPQDYNELIKLPGIGDYTAAAISSIAFDKKNIVVDGNIERVLSRVYTILIKWDIF